MTNLIQIQQAYIDTVNAGIARWAHRPDGGHAGRIRRGAHRLALRRLARLGFAEADALAAIRQAADVAALERLEVL